MSRGTLLRHFSAGIDDKQFEQPHRTRRITAMLNRVTWRVGTLTFVRKQGRLFLQASMELRPVPNWAFAVLQVSEGEYDLSRPLYVKEPGRKRARRATEGETLYCIIYLLRQNRKNFTEICRRCQQSGIPGKSGRGGKMRTQTLGRIAGCYRSAICGGNNST